MQEPDLCVLCRCRPVTPRWAPFCRERCRNRDLAGWLDGAYRVAGEPVPSQDTEADER